GEHHGKLAQGVPAATFKGLPPGPYEVDVISDGVSPFHKRVELRPGEAEVVTASFGESQGAAQLRLKVSPETASVWLDGVEMSTDEPIALRIGKHELRVFKDGYEEQHLALEARPGENLDRKVELHALRGAIEVASEPDGAEVSVGGHVKGRT